MYEAKIVKYTCIQYNSQLYKMSYTITIQGIYIFSMKAMGTCQKINIILQTHSTPKTKNIQDKHCAEIKKNIQDKLCAEIKCSRCEVEAKCFSSVCGMAFIVHAPKWW